MIKLGIEAFVILYIALLYGSVSESCDVQGYYWRDFTGEVPPDALPGGSDIYGRPIYIGKVFNLQNLIIPVKIYVNDPTAYYEYGGKSNGVTQFVMILCTQHPEHFIWIRSNNEEIKFLTNTHLIIGGYNPGSTVYIGRIRVGGETTIGKLITESAIVVHNGLHVTSGPDASKHDSFEVLSYNPDASNCSDI